LPDLTTIATEVEPPRREPVLVADEGNWNVSPSLDREGWIIESNYAFEVQGAGDERRLVKLAGWIENPDRFVLRKVE
jgi:hypothetical protein